MGSYKDQYYKSTHIPYLIFPCCFLCVNEEDVVRHFRWPFCFHTFPSHFLSAFGPDSQKYHHQGILKNIQAAKTLLGFFLSLRSYVSLSQEIIPPLTLKKNPVIASEDFMCDFIPESGDKQIRQHFFF